jgi:hypothetical protein
MRYELTDYEWTAIRPFLQCDFRLACTELAGGRCWTVLNGVAIAKNGARTAQLKAWKIRGIC